MNTERQNYSPIDTYFNDANINTNLTPLQNAEFNDEGQRKEQLYNDVYGNLDDNLVNSYVRNRKRTPNASKEAFAYDAVFSSGIYGYFQNEGEFYATQSN